MFQAERSIHQCTLFWLAIEMTQLIFFALTALWMPSAMGQGKACEGLKNEEITNRCLAIRDRDPKRCNMIGKEDIKYFCLAVVLNNQHQCNHIKDADNKKECFKAVR